MSKGILRLIHTNEYKPGYIAYDGYGDPFVVTDKHDLANSPGDKATVKIPIIISNEKINEGDKFLYRDLILTCLVRNDTSLSHNCVSINHLLHQDDCRKISFYYDQIPKDILQDIASMKAGDGSVIEIFTPDRDFTESVPGSKHYTEAERKAIIIDITDKYKDKVLFPEALARANEIISNMDMSFLEKKDGKSMSKEEQLATEWWNIFPPVDEEAVKQYKLDLYRTPLYKAIKRIETLQANSSSIKERVLFDGVLAILDTLLEDEKCAITEAFKDGKFEVEDGDRFMSAEKYFNQNFKNE